MPTGGAEWLKRRFWMQQVQEVCWKTFCNQSMLMFPLVLVKRNAVHSTGLEDYTSAVFE